MVLKNFKTDVLKSLCSQNQLDLVDAVDTLRSQGISHYVSLPQIIVCGDQSSGKSSVLEAISGVPFPINSSLCTRFPTELILRKTSKVSLTVSIVPHQSRSDSDKQALNDFHEQLDNFDNLPLLIESAKAAMGVSGEGTAFAQDLLRVEISGPDRPQLTIVDLPGLIHSETRQQSSSDVEAVQEIVQRYMKQPRSIILAVVSAKNDYANQVVLKLARLADKNGMRTLGVITKPDTLIPESKSEALYISLANNEEIEFRFGWHVLKNMDSEKGVSSLPHRNYEEAEYFAQGIWKDMPRSLLGVEELRDKLSKILLRQITLELPSLINEIETKLTDCRSSLDRLGQPRVTLDEQRTFLVRCSQSFQSIIKASVDGTYNDPFFGDAQPDVRYVKRIRAVIQNLNNDFAKVMAKDGHYYTIVDTETKSSCEGPHKPKPKSRDAFIDHVESLMQRSRGRELPGTFNPLIVVDLFREQSAPWAQIAHDHVTAAVQAISECLEKTVNHICGESTGTALLEAVVMPASERLNQDSKSKTAELLVPHQEYHPISYNHYFTENVQKIRNKRSRDVCTKIIKSFFGVSTLSPIDSLNREVDLAALVTALSQRTEPDMNRFACSEAMDCMQAYYQVALKRFIDDIAIEVIEAKLLTPLADVFSPILVANMAPDLITQIAGEREENRVQRERLDKRLEILLKGLQTCRHIIDVSSIENPGLKNLHINDIDNIPESSHDALVPPESSMDEHKHSPVIVAAPLADLD